MQRQLLRFAELRLVERSGSRPRHPHPLLAAMIAAVALAGCGSGEPQLQGASGDSTAANSVNPSGGKSEPIPPSSEVTSSDEVVVPSFDPSQGEGTPILVTDPLTQPEENSLAVAATGGGTTVACRARSPR